MAKQKSKNARWAEAAGNARLAFDSVREGQDTLANALGNLKAIQEEYEEWQSNLPENLENSAVGEKLQAVCDIDIESVMDDPLERWIDTEQVIEEAEGIELPLGFGRD